MIRSDLALSTRFRRWLATEPLVHFIALGALIFAVYGALGQQDAVIDRRIEVNAQDLARLRALSIKQWGREPDTQTMQNLVQSFVREEVLYREALASGMDRDDVIVRRRLAQKMEFLANEELAAPSEAELRAYFDTHAGQFLQPAQLDFDQIYFSATARGASVQADARHALEELRGGRFVSGDNFMLPATYVRQDRQQVQRDYGELFSRTVFALPTGVWAGPVASAHGLHLVRVRQHHAARSARFEDVRERVTADLTSAAVEKARNNAYERLLARYTVVTTPIEAWTSAEKMPLIPAARAQP